MQRPLIITALIILAIIALPLIVAPLLNSQSNQPYTTPQIPTRAEAPPQLDAKDLANTAWAADMRNAEGEWYMEMLVAYKFEPKGRVTLSTRDPAAEGENTLPPGEQKIAEMLFPDAIGDITGHWNLGGDTIHIRMEMLGRTRIDTIQIRGKKLYLHGLQMHRLEHSGNNQQREPKPIREPLR